MRATILTAAMLLLIALTSAQAGGPGRNLRPGETRSTQATALSADGPKESTPIGPVEIAISTMACLAAIVIAAVRKVELH